MTPPSPTLREADPGDLSDWAAMKPGSECRPHNTADLKRLLQAGWPHRRVTLPHRRAPGHRAVDQDVTVVPTAMYRRLCEMLGWRVADNVDVFE